MRARVVSFLAALCEGGDSRAAARSIHAELLRPWTATTGLSTRDPPDAVRRIG